MGIATSDKPFTERIKDAEADKFMRASVAKAQDAQFQKRTEARRQLGHWEGWRDLSAEIRQHVIKHLPDYLEEFSDNVQKMVDMFSLPKMVTKQVPLLNN